MFSKNNQSYNIISVYLALNTQITWTLITCYCFLFSYALNQSYLGIVDIKHTRCDFFTLITPRFKNNDKMLHIIYTYQNYTDCSR